MLAAAMLLPMATFAQSTGMQVNVAVNNTTMGTTLPAPGVHYFNVGDTPSVVAVPNSGYVLTGWDIQMSVSGVMGIDTTVNVATPDVFDLISLITGDGSWVVGPTDLMTVISVTANFVDASVYEPDSMTVNVGVNDATMGTTTPLPGTYRYGVGDTVSVVAEAYENYRLTGWNINVSLNDQTVMDTTIEMAVADVFPLIALALTGENDWVVDPIYATATISVTANFIDASQYIPDSMIVNVAVNNATMGTVVPGVGTHYFAEGDTCHVVAEANNGYHLTGWDIEIVVGGATVIDTTINIAIRDVFDLVILIDELRSRGDMSAYELIQMLARPMGDWVVEPLYAQATFNLTANFAPGNPASTHITYAVVNHDATRGSITPAEGTYNINAGEPVIASATANYGYEMTAWIMEYTYPIWGIDLPVVSDTIRVNDPDFSNPVRFLGVMQQMLDTIPQIAMYLTAVFTPRQYTMTVNTADASMGSVEPHGSINVNYGGTFTTTAYPNAGYHFVHWADENGTVVSTDNPYSFSVTGDVYLVGVFAAGGYYTVNVNWDATMGTVDAPTEPVMGGSAVTLTATANDGYRFVNWTGVDGSVLSTNNVYNITVTEDVTLNANFERETGIDGIEAGEFEVYAIDNTIVVKGVENMPVSVYDALGRSMGELGIRNSEIRIEVHTAGIYLVKVGNATKRVAVIR